MAVNKKSLLSVSGQIFATHELAANLEEPVSNKIFVDLGIVLNGRPVLWLAVKPNLRCWLFGCYWIFIFITNSAKSASCCKEDSCPQIFCTSEIVSSGYNPRNRIPGSQRINIFKVLNISAKLLSRKLSNWHSQHHGVGGAIPAT